MVVGEAAALEAAAAEGAAGAAPRLVAVTACTIAGNSYEVQVPENAKVLQAKEELERLLGYRPSEQRLILGGQILDDDLQPFSDLEPGCILQLVRVPFVSLKRYIQHCPQLTTKEVNDLTLQDLVHVFSKAAMDDMPDVCSEIMSHAHWGPEIADRKDLLQVVAIGGFAKVFEELVRHQFFGKREGVLDGAFMALHVAAKRGLSLHCQALLRSPNFTAAAERNPHTQATALHHAANEAILRLLLGHEALAAADCINAVDRRGCTCLHYASTEGACRAILEQPAFTALDVEDSYGQTALHTARVPGMCAAIVEHPLFMSINQGDELGAPPLHYLVRTTAALPLLQERRSALKFLPRGKELGSAAVGLPPGQSVSHAALHMNIDAVDERGRTALFAVRSGEVCRALFAAGFTNLYAVDVKSGRNALQECSIPEVLQEILARPGLDLQRARAHDALGEATAAGRSEVANVLRRAVGDAPKRPGSLPATLPVAAAAEDQRISTRWCIRVPCTLM